MTRGSRFICVHLNHLSLNFLNGLPPLQHLGVSPLDEWSVKALPVGVVSLDRRLLRSLSIRSAAGGHSHGQMCWWLRGLDSIHAEVGTFLALFTEGYTIATHSSLPSARGRHPFTAPPTVQ
jgi:hypothetical protein